MKYILRKAIFRRDNYICSICCKKKDDLVVQHVIPRRLGGSDSPDNLSTMCRKCHGVTELRKKIIANRRIIEGPIIKRATRIGGSVHVIIPKDWIGLTIKCTRLAST